MSFRQDPLKYLRSIQPVAAESCYRDFGWALAFDPGGMTKINEVRRSLAHSIETQIEQSVSLPEIAPVDDSNESFL